MYHKSVWQYNVKRHVSPLDAFNDDELLERAIENCSRYMPHYLFERNVVGRIIDRFIIAKIAPRVTLFKPSLAKRLIGSYLSDYSTVLDPFSGFSGRMLGTLQSGKQYAGFDINETTVQESNAMILGEQLTNCSVQVEDVTKSSHTGDCVLTCPPYNDKEQWGESHNMSCDDWIDVVLANYSCERYVFVVDKTKRQVSEHIANGKSSNHINSASSQKVIVI
jgi:hypothetical protein